MYTKNILNIKTASELEKYLIMSSLRPANSNNKPKFIKGDIVHFIKFGPPNYCGGGPILTYEITRCEISKIFKSDEFTYSSGNQTARVFGYTYELLEGLCLIELSTVIEGMVFKEWDEAVDFANIAKTIGPIAYSIQENIKSMIERANMKCPNAGHVFKEDNMATFKLNETTITSKISDIKNEISTINNNINNIDDIIVHKLEELGLIKKVENMKYKKIDVLDKFFPVISVATNDGSSIRDVITIYADNESIEVGYGVLNDYELTIKMTCDVDGVDFKDFLKKIQSKARNMRSVNDFYGEYFITTPIGKNSSTKKPYDTARYITKRTFELDKSAGVMIYGYGVQPESSMVNTYDLIRWISRNIH